MLLPDLHTNFSRGRSGGLVFPSLSEWNYYRFLGMVSHLSGTSVFAVIFLLATGSLHYLLNISLARIFQEVIRLYTVPLLPNNPV